MNKKQKGLSQFAPNVIRSISVSPQPLAANNDSLRLDDSMNQTFNYNLNLNSSRAAAKPTQIYIKPKTQDKYAEKSKQTNQKKLRSLSMIGTMRFFLKHSYIEMKRNRGYYCLSFCSCLLVIICTLTIMTVLDRSSLIFLSRSEGSAGQIDGKITAVAYDSLSLHSPKLFVNATQLNTLYNQFQISPRKKFASISIQSNQVCTGLGVFQSNVIADNKTLYNASGCFKSVGYATNLYLINTAQEALIGCGRSYEYGTLGPGQCLIHSNTAYLLNVGVGDVIYLEVELGTMLDLVVATYNKTNSKPIVANGTTSTYLPCYVSDIFSNLGGKFADSAESTITLMEIDAFFQHLVNYLPPAYANFTKSKAARFKDLLANQTNPEWYSDYIVLNLPEPRTQYYMSSNYDKIQKDITAYASDAITSYGFYALTIDLPLLTQMQSLSTIAMYLGLIFDIVIFLFAVLSIFLLYTLLMITVETRTFEIGVFRMVGLNRVGLVMLVVMQAIFFVLPAVVIGFWASFGVLAIAFYALSTMMNATFDSIPSTDAIVTALILGVVIPLAASLAPIKTALGRDLNESLDYTHSKTKAIYMEVLSSNSLTNSAAIWFGLITVAYGAGIGYLLPYSLLSTDTQLLIQVFIVILVGMLVGLTLFTLNIRPLLELLYAYVFLFYEKAHVRSVVIKNLVAHTIRNNSTSIMYSIGLGFIIFLITSLSVEINSWKLQTLATYGDYLELSIDGNDIVFDFNKFEDVIAANSDLVDSFAWVTFDLGRVVRMNLEGDVKVSDIVRYNAASVGLYGVSASIFNTTVNQFLSLNWQNTSTGLALGEQLYTARGSQSAAIGSNLAGLLNVDKNSLFSRFLIDFERNTSETYFQFKPTFLTDSAPGFQMASYTSDTIKESVLVSIPTYRRLSKASSLYSDVYFSRLLIKLKSQYQQNTYAITALKIAFQQSFTTQEAIDIKIWDYNELNSTLTNITMYLDFFFISIICIAMLLCFFSLTAAMTANAMEQTKEIGVLRAMGFTKTRIILLYMYESFILVFASATLGLVIGVATGYIMTSQQALLSNLPLQFYFPTWQFLAIFGCSVLSGVFSAVFPVRRILKKQIAQIIKM